MRFSKTLLGLVSMRVLLGWACFWLAAVGEREARAGVFRPELLRGPTLQLATADSIVIVWRTLGETQPVVRYGVAPDKLGRAVQRTDILVREGLEEVPDGVFQYEARIVGLSPLTTYYYAIYDGDRCLAGGDAEHRFATYPRRGEAAPLRFTALADTHGHSWHLVNLLMTVRDFANREGRSLDLLVHCGDITGHGHDIELQESFEAQAELMRQAVIWVSPGNHEMVQGEESHFHGPYLDSYVCPTNGEAGGRASGAEMYYSYDECLLHHPC